MIRLMIRLLAACALIAGTLAPAISVDAGAARGELDLVLLEQGFAINANGRWRATFGLEGDADALAAVTTTTTTTTTTTSSASTAVSNEPDDLAPSTTVGARSGGDRDPELRIVTYLPIDDRIELQEFVDGDDRSAIGEFRASLASSLETSGTATRLEVDVATTVEPDVERALLLRRSGLYPLAVQVVVDGDVVAEHRTFVERQPIEPSDAAPIDLALLASISEPPPGDVDELTDDQRAELDALTDLADGYAGPLTVALPPAILRGLDAEAPGLQEALRTALADDELLSLPSAALDPSAAVSAGQVDAFTRRLVDGEQALDAFSSGAPATRSIWLADAPLSTGAARLLRDLGVDLVVVDGTTYGQLDGNIGGFFDTTLATDVDLGDGGRLRSAVLSPLSELIDPGRPSADGPVDAAVQILAELMTTRRELGDDVRRGVVLAAPDGLPDEDVARALGELVRDLDDVRLAAVSQLGAAIDTMIVDDDRSTVVLPDRAGPDLTARLERIELTRTSTESAASMQLDGGDAGRWTAQLDALVTTALTDDQADAVLDQVAAEAAAIRGSVDAPDPFDFTLTGRSSTLRLNVRNNADQALQVIVRPRSPKLTFPEGPQLVELVPNGFTEVEIPVEARSNGTSSIEVDLLTPAGDQQINGSVVLTAHVNALTGLSQVITVAAVLILVSWWFGHFRRQRRERSLAAASATSAAALDEVSPDAAEAAGPSGLFDDDDFDFDLDPASGPPR